MRVEIDLPEEAESDLIELIDIVGDMDTACFAAFNTGVHTLLRDPELRAKVIAHVNQNGGGR